MIVDNKKAQKCKRGKKTILNTYYSNYLNQFKKWMQRLGYAKTTTKTYTLQLTHFFKYLQEEQVPTIYHIKQQHISNYNTALHLQDISRSYILGKLKVIKSFSEYLEKTQNYKLTFKDLMVEKTVTIERIILTKKEIKTLFTSLENTAEDIRNNAILHLYYSCGLRSNEAIKVRCKDIDYHKQLIYVVPGKNYHSRYVPISTSVAKDLKFYEQYTRPLLNPNGKYFIVSAYTDEMSTQVIARYFKRIKEKACITKNITLHGLRHSIATHLLQQGMDLEIIGQFLGHKSLEATQIYVRMSNEYLND